MKRRWNEEKKQKENKSPENLLLMKIKIPEMIFYFLFSVLERKKEFSDIFMEFMVDDGTPLNY